MLALVFLCSYIKEFPPVGGMEDYFKGTPFRTKGGNCYICYTNVGRLAQHDRHKKHQDIFVGLFVDDWAKDASAVWSRHFEAHFL